MADAKCESKTDLKIEAPPAYQAVPTQIQEENGNDQGYHPNYTHAGSGIQSSNSVVVVNQPTQNMLCVVHPIPPDYMALAIMGSLCCCWPLGLVAFILAIKTKSLADRGHYDAAKKMSNITLGFINASFVLGFVLGIAVIVLRGGIYRSYIYK